jgi:hypothetical protein
VPLDDPTREVLWTHIMAQPAGQRRAPFALQRLSVPDPFEHHQPIRLKLSPTEERLTNGDLLRLP